MSNVQALSGVDTSAKADSHRKLIISSTFARWRLHIANGPYMQNLRACQVQSDRTFAVAGPRLWNSLPV